MNQTADATLHIGGSPIMAHALEEVEEVVDACNALVLNPGTLSNKWIRSMFLAGKRANEKQKPIILDPVGAGATTLRTKTYKKMLKELKINIIKGNQSEIGILYGDSYAKTRGVDCEEGLNNPANVVKDMANIYDGMIVCITGKRDFISDGSTVVAIDNNSDRLGKLTGMGCTAAALTGCFAGVTEDYLIAAVGGLATMGVCAELAQQVDTVRGPSSFKTALFDQFANLTPEQLEKYAKISIL